jgi:hypothetical protein
MKTDHKIAAITKCLSVGSSVKQVAVRALAIILAPVLMVTADIDV